MEETKKGSGTTDLTVGRPLPQILKFALPLVLGTLFQQSCTALWTPSLWGAVWAPMHWARWVPPTR